MNEWATISNKLLDLYTDNYYSMVNTMLRGQEMMFNFTRTLVAQAEEAQVEAKKFVEESTERAQRAQAVIREVWQEGAKATTVNVNAFRAATDVADLELDRKVEAFNGMFAAAPVIPKNPFIN